MKLKFVASTRDVTIFLVFALFLLYVVAIGVLNIPEIAAKGTFYGLNPLEAFSSDYISYTLIIYFVALAGLIMSVNSYFFEFEEGFGLKIGASSSGGYSSWAKVKDIKTDSTIKRVVASDQSVDAAGTPLISNGKELWVDDGEYHTLVIGSTGSGKTQCTILPTIKVLAKKGESVIVTDPKGEIYEKAGGLLKKHGYKIILLNFRNPQNGNTWNPLELPYRLYKNGNQDKAIELLDDLALNILYDETNANSDPFWEKTAADYFSGIALAMFEDTTEDKININSINMTATVGEDKFGGSTYIKEYFNYKDPASAAYVNASGTVMAPSETKGGIISVFKQKVKLFASRENLSEMLSYSDFSMDSIGKEKTAVFIIIQDEKRTYHPLATIFIKQVYETLIDVAQSCGGKLPCRTNFLLDEFANMPPLKDVTTMITAARSRQIRFTIIIQNFAQLNKVYGKDDAETIKGNCGNIIYLISTELAALEEISKLCGEKKSKKDDKTASTPLVSVSDLQRMKQFDQIILRLRKNPFKTSFVPDFKIDWGEEKLPKMEYPVREKRPVNIFDIRDYVKEKKNQKINEMMASIGGDNTPFGGGASSSNSSAGGFGPSIMNNSISNNPMGKKKPELSVNDLVKKIDEKLAEIEKEEEEAKKKKEQEKLSNNKSTTLLGNSKQSLENKPKVVDAKIETIDRKESSMTTFEKKDEKKNVELLDDNFMLSNEEIERKVNEKLSNNIVKEEVKKKEEKINDFNKKIDEKIEKSSNESLIDKINRKFDSNIDDKLDSKIDNKLNKKFQYVLDDDEIESKVNDKIEKKIDEKIDNKLNKKYQYVLDDDEIESEINDKIEKKVEKIDNKMDYVLHNNEIESKENNKIEKKVDEKINSKLDYKFDDFDYEPFEVSKEDEEVLRLIEEKLKEEENDKKNNSNRKTISEPTTVIKLDDVSDDDKFFDDFFED